MRKTMIGSALWLLCIFSGMASAVEPQTLEKIKTGILPTGGFYSIYQVACADNSVANVAARSRRGGPWCSGEGTQLQCFKRSSDAVQLACSAGAIADNDANPDMLNRYQ